MARYPLLLALALAGLLSCEDAITVDSGFTTPRFVVDAWLTNEAREQQITLSLTSDFYDSGLPAGVTDAEVVVCQTRISTACFTFVHRDSGRYVWGGGAAGATLGEVGEELILGIERGEERYVSRTQIYRVPPIDSISFQEEEEALGLEAGTYAQLYARDLPGVGDTYLARTTVNDTLLQRPAEINLIYDAVFDPGTNADGITFIFPIRFSINRVDDDGAPVPLSVGDSVAVDLWSLSPAAYRFLRVARDQIQNGDNGIFGIPVANSPGNVFDARTQQRIIGMFNVAAVSSKRRVFE